MEQQELTLLTTRYKYFRQRIEDLAAEMLQQLEQTGEHHAMKHFSENPDQWQLIVINCEKRYVETLQQLIEPQMISLGMYVWLKFSKYDELIEQYNQLQKSFNGYVEWEKNNNDNTNQTPTTERNESESEA